MDLKPPCPGCTLHLENWHATKLPRRSSLCDRIGGLLIHVWSLSFLCIKRRIPLRWSVTVVAIFSCFKNVTIVTFCQSYSSHRAVQYSTPNKRIFYALQYLYRAILLNMWFMGPNLRKCTEALIIFSAILFFLQLHLSHSHTEICKITGYFMLYNIGIPFAYWKMWCRGPNFENIKPLAAVLENGLSSRFSLL